MLAKAKAAPTTLQAVRAAYERRAAEAEPGGDQDWRRDHLGASIAGHSCDRYLWLSFRWASRPAHDGKQLRLFARGDREEAWIIDDLRAAGIEVWDRDPVTREQHRVRWGHVGGGVDGVVRGLLEAPDIPHVLECKTHNAKSFARLQEKGLRSAKPEHFAQVQLYMHGLNLQWAYYFAVCKDNDEVHAERVPLDQLYAQRALDRAQRIVSSPQPPKRMDPMVPPCIYVSKEGKVWPCQFFDLCHGDAVMPEKNCRTCVSSTPMPDGTWRCEEHNCTLGGSAQRKGCGEHLTIPAIVNAQVAEIVGRKVTYQAVNGRRFEDGGS